MTQKSIKKVTKNIERPKPFRGNREVIRHFDPSINAAACRSNLNENIPFVNVEPSEEHKSENSASKPNKTIKLSRAIRTLNPNNKLRVNLDIKNSSSSSLDTKLDKFINKSPRGGKPKPKSKSFHLGPTRSLARNPKDNQNVVSSARERQLPEQSKLKTLRSSTDPALVKELNIRLLKQEILDNKRGNVQRTHHPEAWGPINNPQVEDLKSEILQSKTNSILNKKILITELKSEVARYKHYGNFLVYNVEEDAKKKQETNNHQRLSNKKVLIQEENENSKENKDKYLALMYQNFQPNIGPSSDRSNDSSTAIDKQDSG